MFLLHNINHIIGLYSHKKYWIIYHTYALSCIDVLKFIWIMRTLLFMNSILLVARYKFSEKFTHWNFIHKTRLLSGLLQQYNKQSPVNGYLSD